MRKQIQRLALVATFEKLPRCVVGMEACLNAHFVSLTLRKLGFEPRIMPTVYVKPFIKGQKYDHDDAEALAEAALRPNLPVVPEKSQEQLDLQALHRARSRLVSRRTATIQPELRLSDRTKDHGPQRFTGFEELIREDPGRAQGRDITWHAVDPDWSLWQFALDDDRIETVSKEIEQISRTEENCVNVMTIPGIGPMISNAMKAAIGTGKAFGRGRDSAA